MEIALELVRAIRNLRQEAGTKPGEKVKTTLGGDTTAIHDLADLIAHLAQTEVTFGSGSGQAAVVRAIEVRVALERDPAEHRARLEKELAEAKDTLRRSRDLLARPGFAEKAPANVVADEKREARGTRRARPSARRGAPPSRVTTAYICVTCGVQQSTERVAARALPDLRGRAPVHPSGRAGVDDARPARGARVTASSCASSSPVSPASAPSLRWASASAHCSCGRRAATSCGTASATSTRKSVESIKAMGGVAGIAFSHPHFYGVMVEWSQAFGGCPIWIPTADRMWVQREDPAIVEWSGTREVLPGVTLIQTGGHFEGSAVLHWAAGAGGKGALFVGDSIGVVADVRAVSFMRSYPNLIPLPADEIRRIVAAVEPYAFDRIYGGWWDRVTPSDGKAAVKRSARRYLKWIGAGARSPKCDRADSREGIGRPSG